MLVDVIPLRDFGRRLSSAELAALEPVRGILRVTRNSDTGWLFARLMYARPGWPGAGGRMDLLPTLADVRLVALGPEGIVLAGYVSTAADGRVARGDRQGWWCKPVAPDAPVSRFEPRSQSSTTG
ncbi:MAG: hypothetical protein BGO72_21350 [Burkholderiales bacterium 70-64]|nr:MAG: hypothetical protein BGO72_21350 [Burkholderiales bacterium 70-64]